MFLKWPISCKYIYWVNPYVTCLKILHKYFQSTKLLIVFTNHELKIVLRERSLITQGKRGMGSKCLHKSKKSRKS